MAPEQIEGHPRAASDQYALAVVAYEWLCGARPFEGSATEVMVQQLTMPPPPLRERMPTIPAEVEQVVLRALAKDPKARFASVQAFAEAFEQASQPASSSLVPPAAEPPSPGPAPTVALAATQPGVPTETTPSADVPAGAFESTVYPGSSPPNSLDTPESGAAAEALQPGHFGAFTAAVVPAPLEPTMPVQQKSRRLPSIRAALLMGLVVVIIAGGMLGTHRGASAPMVVRGGTRTTDFPDYPSLIPDTSYYPRAVMAQQALYLPLFYGDAHGGVHPGAATAIPTVQNGGISADATTWTFHLRPHLLWSDGQPYDARDVAYTWKLMLNPKFYYGAPILGLNPSSLPEISTDDLSITFHLKQPFAPFLALWIDGYNAPLPAHHFSGVAQRRS